MRDPFVNYDAWLEAPYQRACEEADRFWEAAEALGLSEEEAESGDFDDEIQAYWDDIEDDAAQEQYEAYLEFLDRDPDWDRE